MPESEQSAPRAYAALAARPHDNADRALDWLNFSVANIQTGFGPFIVVYLTSRG